MSTTNTTPAAQAAMHIADRALDILFSDITGRVFQIINEDKKLNREYLRAVEAHDLNTINQTIGKHIKRRFGLGNAGRDNKPKGNHILSYEKYNLP